MPAVALKEIGGRGENVGNTAHEIPVAIAVEIDRVPDIRGPQELRLADFAGPAAAQLLSRQVAPIDDPHGVEQLAGKELGAPTIVGSVASDRRIE